MSIKKAQKIVNELEETFGFSALSYQTSELETIKDLLEKFLEEGVETEDLQEPDELSSDDGAEDDEEESEDE